jgi:hypothetical protein
MLSLYKYRFPPDFPGGKFTLACREVCFEAGFIRDRGTHWEITPEGQMFLNLFKERPLFAR